MGHYGLTEFSSLCVVWGCHNSPTLAVWHGWVRLYFCDSHHYKVRELNQ